MTEQREMAKAYEPQATEERVYEFWEQRRYFEGKIDASKQPFSIIMPPPNVTGELHIGHALTDTVEDILIRWHRMLGDPTLWLPGVDHAGIATQNVVEKQLAKEGLSRHDLGREAFEERVWQWVRQYRPIISQQHRRLGASADWSHEVFTLDDGPQLAVRTTFKKLHDDGLIYRGERLINWCPRCQTALSDLEVEHEDQQGNLWYIRYPVVEGTDADGKPRLRGDFVTVATTRPETYVGDVAVAVNPKDSRYASAVGLSVMLPVIQRVIPVLGDDAVEMEFGTGAVKVTPGHDPTDFEIGQRHNLPIINAMKKDATMNEQAGPYAGMDRYEARQVILRDLQELGYLEKTDPHAMTIGTCARCGTVIEPLMSWQWFVRMESLARPGIDAVREGKIRFVPDRFERIYLNWMENIRDWCVSRQLWWGHRIPVWYSGDEDGERIVVTLTNPHAPDAPPRVATYAELRAEGVSHETIVRYGSWTAVDATPIVSVETPERSPTGGGHLLQESDVLDTWFSSGLWPFSTLGWPRETEELKYWYPTSVMETGYDIIFLWVARMIMMGLYGAGEIPYSVVYLHGTVRNERGQRMSKSLGTGVDPLVVVKEYGADALRYTLITSSGPGNDLKLSLQRVEAGRNFANKLWNAARFVIAMIGEGTVRLPEAMPDPDAPLEDRWIMSRVEELARSVDALMQRFEMGEAARQVYEFVWSEFADWYIEIAKVRVRGERSDGPSPLPVLAYVLDRCLRLLHPVMPFVTEEIWQNLALKIEGVEEEALIVARYPRGESGYRDIAAENEMERVIDVVRAIRNIRAEKKVEPGKFIEAYAARTDAVLILGGKVPPRWEDAAPYIEHLARVRPLHLIAGTELLPKERVATAVLDRIVVAVPLSELFDIDKERARLAKAIAAAQAERDRIAAQLENAQFLSKAPEELVQATRERLGAADERLDELRASLRELG